MRRAALGASKPFSELVLDGVRTAYNDEGYGPAVVCVHGAGHGAGDYQRLRTRLRDRYRVLTLDWPGHGHSDVDPQPVSVARWAELLRLFLVEARVERAVIVGHGFGGAAALRFACDHPHRVRGLVLSNPAGLDPRDRLSGLGIGAMVRLFQGGRRGAAWYPFAFSQVCRVMLAEAPAELQRARVIAAAPELAPVMLEAWESLAEPESDLRGLARKVECPVLFAWADQDRFFPLSRHLPALLGFPSAQLVTFRAGHCPPLETPEPFERAVEDFLAGLAKPEAAA